MLVKNLYNSRKDCRVAVDPEVVGREAIPITPIYDTSGLRQCYSEIPDDLPAPSIETKIANVAL